jgi:hypothetical protein
VAPTQASGTDDYCSRDRRRYGLAEFDFGPSSEPYQLENPGKSGKPEFFNTPGITGVCKNSGHHLGNPGKQGNSGSGIWGKVELRVHHEINSFASSVGATTPHREDEVCLIALFLALFSHDPLVPHRTRLTTAPMAVGRPFTNHLLEIRNMSHFPWNRMLKSTSRPAATRQRLRPQIEGLEQRLALAVSFALVNGQLLVTGDGAADTITLDHLGPGRPGWSPTQAPLRSRRAR